MKINRRYKSANYSTRRKVIFTSTVALLAGLTLTGSTVSAQEWVANAPETIKIEKGAKEYTMVYGDTYWAVAQAINVNHRVLMEANGITSESAKTLPVGHVIKLVWDTETGVSVEVKDANGTVVGSRELTTEDKIDQTKEFGVNVATGETTIQVTDKTTGEVVSNPTTPTNNGVSTPTTPADNGGTQDTGVTTPADNGTVTTPTDNTGGNTGGTQDTGSTTTPADNTGNTGNTGGSTDTGTTPPADNGGSQDTGGDTGTTPPADNGGGSQDNGGGTQDNGGGTQDDGKPYDDPTPDPIGVHGDVGGQVNRDDIFYNVPEVTWGTFTGDYAKDGDIGSYADGSFGDEQANNVIFSDWADESGVRGWSGGRNKDGNHVYFFYK